MGMVMVINPAANVSSKVTHVLPFKVLTDFHQGTSSLAQYQQLSIAAGANIIPQGGASGGTLANTVPGT
jgi:hypothetical protein